MDRAAGRAVTVKQTQRAARFLRQRRRRGPSKAERGKRAGSPFGRTGGRQMTKRHFPSQTWLALVGLRGDGGTSHDQSRDEGAKESFASASGVVHELEEAEIQRQLLLRDAPVWPQPGA